jgi:tetratricopeptide (TPR) repeat protein
LGVATKEVVATAPLVLLLYDRAFLAGSFGKSLAARWGLYLTLSASWVFIAWELAATEFHENTTGFGVREFTASSYLLTEPRVVLDYLRLAAWPTDLCLDYNLPPASTAAEIIPAATVVLALLALTIWGLIKRPELGFLGAWFFLILAPTTSFVPIADAEFEHRMYLPLAGIVALLVCLSYGLWDRFWYVWLQLPSGFGRSAIAGGALIVVVVALAGATFARNGVYRSKLAIWQNVLETHPRNARAHANVGLLLAREGRIQEAIAESRLAIEIKPNFAGAHRDLGAFLLDSGEIDDSIEQHEIAVEIEPNREEFHVNLAGALLRKGRFDEAIAQYRQALSIKPSLVEARTTLAGALLRQGKVADAIHESEEALKLDPDSARIHHNLAESLISQGQIDEGIKHCKRALEIQPNFAAAHFNLGNTLYQRGQTLDAITHLRAAVKLEPNQAWYLARLAWVLATSPDDSSRSGAESILLAQRAAELTLNADATALDTLAAAYAESGQFDNAVAIGRQALASADAQGKSELSRGIRERLNLYNAKRPFHESTPSPGKRGDSALQR